MGIYESKYDNGIIEKRSIRRHRCIPNCKTCCNRYHHFDLNNKISYECFFVIKPYPNRWIYNLHLRCTSHLMDYVVLYMRNICIWKGPAEDLQNVFVNQPKRRLPLSTHSIIVKVISYENKSIGFTYSSSENINKDFDVKIPFRDDYLDPQTNFNKLKIYVNKVELDYKTSNK